MADTLRRTTVLCFSRINKLTFKLEPEPKTASKR